MIIFWVSPVINFFLKNRKNFSKERQRASEFLTCTASLLMINENDLLFEL